MPHEGPGRLTLRTQVGLLILACTLPGLALIQWLAASFTDLDLRQRAAGEQALVIKDLERFEGSLQFFVLSTDLALPGGSTYLAERALRQVEPLKKVLAGLADTLPVSRFKVETSEIEGRLDALGSMVEESLRARTGDPSRSEQLRAAADEAVDRLITTVGSLRTLVAQALASEKAGVAADLNALRFRTAVSLVAYLLMVGGLWLWTVRTMIRPMRELTYLAERAWDTDETLESVSGGPAEVQAMNESLSRLVDDLVDSRQDLEDKVRQRTGMLVEAKNAAEAAHRQGRNMSLVAANDMKAPIRGILGACELLARTEMDSDQRDRLIHVQQAAHRLLKIALGIGAESDGDIVSMRFEPRPMDLPRCLESVVEGHRAAATHKGLDLSLRFGPGSPSAVVADPDRIAQLIGNLVENAIRHTDKGGIQVGVEGHEAAGDVRVRFRVIDSGEGVPADRKEEIFEQFLHGTQDEAAGLGLAVVRRIVDRMGGEVGVDSEVGKGSHFWCEVTMPRVPA